MAVAKGLRARKLAGLLKTTSFAEFQIKVKYSSALEFVRRKFPDRSPAELAIRAGNIAVVKNMRNAAVTALGRVGIGENARGIVSLAWRLRLLARVASEERMAGESVSLPVKEQKLLARIAGKDVCNQYIRGVGPAERSAFIGKILDAAVREVNKAKPGAGSKYRSEFVALWQSVVSAADHSPVELSGLND